MPQEVIDPGDDTLVVRSVGTMPGRTTGLRGTVRFTQAWRLHEHACRARSASDQAGGRGFEGPVALRCCVRRDTGNRMVRETRDGVRHKLGVKPRRRRGIEERLIVRVPWVARLWAWVLARMSPTSRVRQILLVRAVQLGLAAYNRGDLAPVLLAHRPDAEYHGRPEERELGTLGLRGTYRGHDGYREFDAEWRSAWDSYWVVPQELIDYGDRYLLVAQMAGRARGSTVTVSAPVAILNILDHAGLIVREHRLSDESAAHELLASLP